MRYAQKQEILNFIDNLYQAHEEVREQLQKSNIAVVQNMLSECQEFAVSLGEIIERSEGEGHRTVTYIEEYCELLFHVYEKITGREFNENQIFKILRTQLIKIENSVRNDIKLRKEIAFFPYKASMWDSLESIYLKLKEDENNDVYCVPIPYYEVNPDHSLGRRHYEGLKYPENIEVIDYRTYNFEERNPDEIYIHNPYDNYNLVTSVEPRFYSDKLKKHTAKLVYSPYFVLQEIEPDDQAAIDGMKHFIWMPGVINADEVILQSEKMKQIYVNEYLKAAIANGLSGTHIDRNCLENKFKGTGSPKIEKILRTKRENLEIPKEWEHILHKPDGSRKKVILYNTGIAALLQYNEKWVEKIEDSLRIFRENKDDVALLWRPHPLIESSMKSMRPGILQRYTRIKNQYIADRWGIYDDTPDLDRAVALSDAYYGDRSSVVNLYQAVGKAVMVQNVENFLPAEHSICSAEAVVKVDNYYWMIPLWRNGIFRMDSQTYEIELMSEIEGINISNKLFFSAVLCDDEIFFAPFAADRIMFYNINKKESGYINLSRHENISGLFMHAVKIENKVYFMPFHYPAIVILDIKDKEVCEINVSDFIEIEAGQEICRVEAAVIKDRIYFVCETDAQVYYFDTISLKVKKVGILEEQYSNVYEVNNRLCCIPKDVKNHIVLVDIEKEIIINRIVFPDDIVIELMNDKNRFYSGVSKENIIYIRTLYDTGSIIVDTYKGVVTRWNIPERSDYEKQHWNGNRVHLLGDNIYIINDMTGEWFTYFAEEDEWRIIPRKSSYRKTSITANSLIYENNFGTPGSTIYDFLKL